MYADRHTVGVRCAAVVILQMLPMGALAAPLGDTDTASAAGALTSSTAPQALTAEERALLEAAIGHDTATKKTNERAAPQVNTSPIVSAVLGAFQSANPDISLILDVAGSVFSDAPLQLGQFVRLNVKVGTRVSRVTKKAVRLGNHGIVI